MSRASHRPQADAARRPSPEGDDETSGGPALRRDRPGAAQDDPPHAALDADLSQRLRQALTDALSDAPDALDEAAGAPPALAVERAAAAIGPMQLASAHPGGARERRQAQAMYERCLTHYRRVMRARDAARRTDDAAAAAACFVAANLEALHDVHATPQMLARLERQLGGVMRRSSAWAAARLHDRQSYVEQLAILAVLVGEMAGLAALQGPAAVANVQRAARGYLQRFLGLNPDHLTLGDDGLGFRARAADARAPLASAA